MRKLKTIITLILLILPICIKGMSFNTYSMSKNNVNNYINKFSDRSKYLLFKQPYDFVNGVLVANNDYKYGGLLSKEEYDISMGKNSSYLAIGREYWTLTSTIDNKKQYYVDNKLLSKDPELNAGIRVTEFVRPEVKVIGTGTSAHPWVFTNKYLLKIQSNSFQYGSVSLTTKDVFNQSISDLVGYNEEYHFKVKEYKGYSYKSSDCNLIKVSNLQNNTFEYKTSPIKKDSICTLNFEKRLITVNYTCGDNNGTPPNSITLSYGQDYSIADYACSKKGFKQTKWKASDGTIWEKGKTGVSTLENGEKGLVNNTITLEPVMEAKKFTVIYKGNGGKYNNTETWTEYDYRSPIYGQEYTVWDNFYTKAGYAFVNWTDSTGTEWETQKANKWIYDNGERGIENDTLVLTANWKEAFKTMYLCRADVVGWCDCIEHCDVRDTDGTCNKARHALYTKSLGGKTYYKAFASGKNNTIQIYDGIKENGRYKVKSVGNDWAYDLKNYNHINPDGYWIDEGCVTDKSSKEDCLYTTCRNDFK